LASIPPGELRGWVEETTAKTLRAWDDGAAPVCLYVAADGRLIGFTLANRHRADLAQAGLGNGGCAFEFEVPKGVDFSRAHVELRRLSDGAPLPFPTRCAA
jgi:hypothetical protein